MAKSTRLSDASEMDASGDLVVGVDGLARPAWAAENPLLREYYDTEWGVAVRDERGLFERISLEGFQAGLSWAIILRKRPAFRRAFCDFEPVRVAAFTDTDIERLMGDADIVRNRKKILATINNARATVALREQGGLVQLVWSFKPEKPLRPHHLADIPTRTDESTALAKALQKAGFKFVGPTNIYATMKAIGMVDAHLVGSHRRRGDVG